MSSCSSHGRHGPLLIEITSAAAYRRPQEELQQPTGMELHRRRRVHMLQEEVIMDESRHRSSAPRVGHRLRHQGTG